MRAISVLICQAALIGAVLFYVRLLTPSFRLGTTTADHPYIAFTAAMMIAGTIWIALIPVIRALLRRRPSPRHVKRMIIAGATFGLLLRAMFFNSVPIYEDDWNRYLWDGAVITQGINPYLYSPDTVLRPSDNPDIIRLRALSDNNGDIAHRINNPKLTTLYPPAAQAVFAGAALIKPFDLDVLRTLFLAAEALSFILLLKALSLYNRSPLWGLLYALNPLLIYAGINVAHMDVLIVPCVLATLIWIRTRPFWAGAALAGAGAVKLWPLLLAPVFYRNYRTQPVLYASCAAFITALSLAAFTPLFLSLGESSGLAAYSSGWTRTSFLFPWLEKIITPIASNPGMAARLSIAALLTLLSLWFGFRRRDIDLPHALLLLSLALFFLSPAGFPWYVIWVLPFLSFTPFYGAALLMASLPLYYIRFALGEQGHYHLYTNIAVPVQFGLPLLVLIYELWRSRKLDYAR